MLDILTARWIKAAGYNGDTATDFFRTVKIKKDVKNAVLTITAHGVFEAYINSEKVGEDVLMPGWTSYYSRLRYISYNVTNLLKAGKNELKVGVGRGWYFHNVDCWGCQNLKSDEAALICALEITYIDGSRDVIHSDKEWTAAKSNIVYNHMYNGETVDLRIRKAVHTDAVEINYTRSMLIPFEGDPIREQERFKGIQLIITPKGEKVIDFGQEITGYVEFSADVPEDTQIVIKHFEVLDKKGNVYTENLRGAKATYTVISDGKPFTVKPRYTFYGFRYIQVLGMNEVNPADFTAIVVHSQMKRTAHFSCSDELLNRFALNVVWGQKGNFLDVPTDCPQRDERLGWTGDAAMFSRTAAINFDVKAFCEKWLNDIEADQLADGSVPHVAPYTNIYWNGPDGYNSPAWSDVAVIMPWELYTAYGDKGILERHYRLMKKWVDFMNTECRGKGGGKIEFPWTNSGFGDWLSLEELNREEGVGATDVGLIATAFHANALRTLIKVNDILGYEQGEYPEILKNITDYFRNEYMENGRMKQETQTAAVLAIIYELTDKPEITFAQLADNVRKHGRITTGFIGSTFLLDALSMAGEDELAVDLLLRKEYPSWLYPVTKGATTVWERWNGIFPDGHFASAGMNSFNHYAYGSVMSWVYRHLAGIMPAGPGYRSIVFAPVTDDRIPSVNADIDTVCGVAAIRYEKKDKGWDFEITVPEGSDAKAVIFGREYPLSRGRNTIIAEK
ncbi:MAG: glycoside hydrolase family 78 protein [Clostridiales bacterium]|nr:glycoside hydrolase family 78 protein [Clostridiales bacterium]